MEHTFPLPVTVTQTCSVASEMTGNDVVLSDFVEQEESSVMESPKKESSEWTDEKHSLYLKSMEASFVDQLYNSLDMRCWQTENECSSVSMSSRKIHASTCYPSGQFKVLQRGCWSRVDFRRENSVLDEADRRHVSSGNPWIQHFRNRSRNEAVASPSPLEKPSLTAMSQQFLAFDSQLCCQQTSCSNTEVTDQNFVEEEYEIEKANTLCSNKRRRTSVVSQSGNDQAASFWHFSCNRNC